MKRVGILTSGGDCPGLNATIRGAAKALYQRFGDDVEIVGILNGYDGLIKGEWREMQQYEFSGILTVGGTILGTKRTPFKMMKVVEGDNIDKVAAMKKTYRDARLDCLLCLGGNGTHKTANLLREGGLNVVTLPKTIDNDLMVTDHTPGYGSAAKYIGVVMKEIIRDATVYGTKYVTVVEIMGRNAGWLTAAAALAKSDDCEGVDMICLPEVPFNVDRFVEKVQAMQETKPSIVIAVSEGVKLEDGRYVCELADDVHAVDAFGHKALTGTARYLANVIARKLDTKTRCIELATLQRCAGHLTSRTDITEAYQVGGAAAKAAFEGVTGQMVALKRLSNNPYQCTTELHPISEVANLEKKVPLSWMNENHTQMTEEFLAYARPLIQAELTPLYIAGLPHHIYMKAKQ